MELISGEMRGQGQRETHHGQEPFRQSRDCDREAGMGGLLLILPTNDSELLYDKFCSRNQEVAVNGTLYGAPQSAVAAWWFWILGVQRAKQ